MSRLTTFGITLVCCLLAVSGCTNHSNQNAPDLATLLDSGDWVDLTHVFSEETLYWPTATNFRKDTVFVGITENNFYYEAFNIFGAEHGGTHLDAPIHFFADRQTVSDIPLNHFMGSAAVVDVSEQALADRNYQISVNDILEWEASHNTTIDGKILLVRTGYSQFWPDPLKYMGTDKKGYVGVLALSFPGMHPETAKWIVENRKMKAFGLDTPSLDYGKSTHFETHRALFEHNIPGFENLTELDKLPANGAYIFALPMKVKRGSGAPLRIIAWIP